MKYLWKLRVYQSWDEVDDAEFLALWHQWVEKSPDAHVFFHPLILKAWTDAFRLSQHISPLYCVAQCDDTTFFLPLILWRRNWKNAFLRVIVSAGFSDYDYHDPVVTAPLNNELMNSFWMLIEDQIFGSKKTVCDEISFTGIRFPGKDNTWQSEKDVCPYSDLTPFESYSVFFASLKKSLRHDVEKKKRRLSEYGELIYRHYKPDESAGALQALPGFLDAHCKRWPKAYKLPGLHAAILSEGIPAGVVHFSELLVDKQVIDWNLGFLFKKRFYYYMSTSPYLEQYAKYSPGKVHLSYLIQDSFNNGVQIFDYLRGAHGYKGEWTEKDIKLYCYLKRSQRLESRFRTSVYSAFEKLKA
ncbi:MAG: GNAT family N-acetyltransferase [Chlorobiaceae bacterium]|jgi:CelD/BcsL family acetyltransferase involved in cellulose biosynthesis|nr:GNAT family N-acetyltransferase [Chlorobiaceae bacterium]NTV16616.1 GNAT family N-acetyltransferase [Chlorobiaceae bacterium]